jgi:hypothetical protein
MTVNGVKNILLHDLMTKFIIIITSVIRRPLLGMTTQCLHNERSWASCISRPGLSPDVYHVGAPRRGSTFFFFFLFLSLSGVGTTYFFSSCYDKDLAFIFTTGRLPDVNPP